MLNKKYKDANELISHDRNAKDYYMSQPEDVMGEINLHADTIHTLDELQQVAMNLVKKI